MPSRARPQEADRGGVAKDDTQAAFWLRKAAEQGLADAQFGLGAAYMVGNGVPRDYSEAYFWLDLAAMGKPGYFTQEKLAKRRDEVASLLSNTALLQAQERARKWLEAHQANPQAKPQ